MEGTSVGKVFRGAGEFGKDEVAWARRKAHLFRKM
jgi:hypothetical protein